MKRIYMTMALIGATTLASYAQKTVDLSLKTITPASNAVYPNFNAGDTLRYAFEIENLGPQDVTASDTLTVLVQTNLLGLASIGPALPLGMPDGYTLPAGQKDTLYWSVRQGQALSSTISINIPSNTTLSTFLAVSGVDQTGTPFIDAGVTDSTIGGNNFSNSTNIQIGSGTGIVEFKNLAKEELSIFPNPASTNVNFQYEFASTSIATVRVSDVTGRSVLVKEFGKQTPGNKQLSLDVSSLQNGTYYMELVTDDKRAISKLTISK